VGVETLNLSKVLEFKCFTNNHLNRGLPGSTIYDLSTVRQAEGEISPRIKCSSLRFKCNRLLYVNRGLPGSAVYDLSTVRQHCSKKILIQRQSCRASLHLRSSDGAVGATAFFFHIVSCRDLLRRPVAGPDDVTANSSH
jgi:hypothetical protein